MTLYGIDVSSWQSPSDLNWTALSLSQKFCIARAAYGDSQDTAAVSHFKNARGAGMKAGLYLFFRQTKSVESQLAAFDAVASACGYGVGDILPALDLEANDKYDGAVNAATYNTNGKTIAEAWKKKYGGCLIYTSRSFWTLLGSPSWILDYPQWTAHWGTTTPAVAGDKPYAIWQYKVASLTGYAGSQIDQNQAPVEPPIILPAVEGSWNIGVEAIAEGFAKVSEGFRLLKKP